MPSQSDALNNGVFINCAFDPDFLDIFRAIVFAVKACGFVPRTAQDVSDSGESRILKIVDIIVDCDRGIHDLSAVRLDTGTSMPRFNMPLELGISLGLKWRGNTRQRRKRILVLDEKPHQYDMSTSDLSGQDLSAHLGKPAVAITCVRNWLAQDRDPAAVALPGGVALASDYTKARALIEGTIAAERLDPWSELPHSDYLRLVDISLKLLAPLPN